MNRVLFSAVFFGLMVCSVAYGAVYGGGSGTAQDPYRIQTAEQFNAIGLNSADWDKSFLLTADIDMSGYTGTQYHIIGNSTTAFTGTFDGAGHRIVNLSYTTTATVQKTGLFGLTRNATIKNLNLESFSVTSMSDYTGGLVGYNINGSVSNCYLTGIVSGYSYTGGLIGNNEGGLLNSCFADCTVIGNEYSFFVGGLVGNNTSGDITGCCTSGSSRGYTEVGGLAGAFDGSMTSCHSASEVQGRVNLGGLTGFCFRASLTSCYATGNVTGTLSSFSAGGLVGTNYATLNSCYATGTVTAELHSIGGLVGWNDEAMITSCFATGSVSGKGCVGGLIGFNSYASATHCYASGSATGIEYDVGGLVGENYYSTLTSCFATGAAQSGLGSVGGLIGNNSGPVTDCYATGAASGTAYIGGLTGVNYNAKLTRCYATGRVTGSKSLGGLVGWNDFTVYFQIIYCYWDIQTTGQTNSSGGGVGRTTAQMMTQSTFREWDFAETWCMTRYPALRWEINPLQSLIDAAADGDVITVNPGIYKGRLYYKGKNVTLTSTDPLNPDTVASTVLRGRGVGPVVTFQGTENADCVLQGFTVEGGRAPLPGGGGIYGGPAAEAMATVRHCVVQNNSTSDFGGGIGGLKGRISHCIIRNNSAKNGGGLSWCDGPIEHCLIINNTATDAGNAIHHCNGQLVSNTVVSGGFSTVSQIDSCAGLLSNSIFYGQDNVLNACTGTVSYSCYPGATGPGNIAANPLFISTNANSPDYHLQPDSPCIDAGDPASDYSLEPWPHGSRINMGAYGNTPQAALSRNVLIPLGFEIVQKTRTGRTTFEYELAVIVQNPNAYELTDARLSLRDADPAVVSVLDAAVTLDTIAAGATVTSVDTFRIVVDRSLLIVPGMLTWELTYYVPVLEGPQQAMVLMSLQGLDAVPGDITGDGSVDTGDLMIVLDQWLGTPGVPSADIAPTPPDGSVNLLDMAVLAEHWLE